MTKAKLAFISFLLLVLTFPLSAAEPELLSVNINEASAEELASVLTGVGEGRAEAIVAYREQHGDFKTVEELIAVKGIGEAILSSNASKIRL